MIRIFVVSLHPFLTVQCLTNTTILVKKSLFLFALITAVFVSCSDHHSAKILNRSKVSLDINALEKEDKSAEITDFDPSAYFIFKGKPMGFNFELLNAFPSEGHHKNTFGYWWKISRYDDMIRQFSSSINWDWRLLASLIYQESRFIPDVTSGAGAYGLMQVMPETGRNFGIDITSSTENNMKAGIKYINWLHSIFDNLIPNAGERMNFILAAYNAGPGHVLDAMRLAEKNGMNPYKWDGSVAEWLLKKSERQYYNDSVVKSGYFRGTESVNFVSQVRERYEHYQNIIQEEKTSPF
jgi:membrane-bound lytic murein transglycosylase MltF